MRTKIGLFLLMLAAAYVVVGLARGWDGLALGATALIVAGGIMLARGHGDALKTRRTGLAAVPPQEPAVVAPTPSAPHPPAPLAEPPAVEEAAPNAAATDRRETMLPPPGAKAAGRPHLRLVHTDGIRMTPQQLRRKAK